jgi:folate-dependent phosphoribosylglycinamide formyltransferase PurN
MDGGNAIVRKEFFINKIDDENSLKKKTQNLEYRAFPEAIIKIFRNS